MRRPNRPKKVIPIRKSNVQSFPAKKHNLKLDTQGDLRRFLLESMVELRNGEIPTSMANGLARLASTVNDSLFAEARIAVVAMMAGQTPTEIGDLNLEHREPLPVIEEKAG